MRQMVLELNASDDRGIDVVREQIKTFASTKQIFSLGGASARAGAGFKLIVLDEADAMTSTAQMALRRIMEKYTVNTRFCIIANYAHKLSPALLSRCTRFRFSPLKEADIQVLVDKVVEEENVKIGGEAVDALVRLSKGDMRRALNVLQACHASSECCNVILLQLLTRGQVRRCDQRMLPRSPTVRSSGTTSQQRQSTTASQRRPQTPSRRFCRRCSTHQT